MPLSVIEVFLILKAKNRAVIEKTRPPKGVYSIADLARREGISEKSARGRLRKYFAGTLSDFGISGWTYGPEDLELILRIIRPNVAPVGRDLNRPATATPPHIMRETKKSNTVSKIISLYSWPRKSRNDHILPDESGVYALFLREKSSLTSIIPLEGGLIYIGLGRSLAKRCHFSGKTEGHSPRRSLAALLWHKLLLEPQLGANGNYGLSKSSEKRLDAWMHENLLMAFDTFDDFKAVEDVLIKQFAPPLNLTKCAQSEQHHAVKGLRKAMHEYAKSHC